MFRQKADSARIFGGNCGIGLGRVFDVVPNIVRLVGIGLAVGCDAMTMLGSGTIFNCIIVSLCGNGFVLARAAVLLLGSGRAVVLLLGSGRAVALLLGSGGAVVSLLGSGRAFVWSLGSGRAVVLLLGSRLAVVLLLGLVCYCDGRGCCAAPLGSLIKISHKDFFQFVRFAVIENIVSRIFFQNNCWIILAVAPTSLDAIANTELIGMIDAFIRHVIANSVCRR